MWKQAHCHLIRWYSTETTALDQRPQLRCFHIFSAHHRRGRRQEGGHLCDAANLTSEASDPGCVVIVRPGGTARQERRSHVPCFVMVEHLVLLLLRNHLIQCEFSAQTLRSWKGFDSCTLQVARELPGLRASMTSFKLQASRGNIAPH